MKGIRLGFFLLAALLAGCGGGGGSSSPAAGNGGSSSSGGVSIWENQINFDNTMAVRVKNLEITGIELKEIGDPAANYELQEGKRKASDLVEIGSSDANLSNRAVPMSIRKASMYRVGVTFTSDSAFPEGLFFTVALVSTAKDRKQSRTVLTKNVFVDEAGEHTLYGNILVPDDLQEGEYLLIAKVSNEQLDTFVRAKEPITDIPQIGGTYVNVEAPAGERRTYVLDINTTKNVDTPFNRRLYFAGNFLQHESGKGRFLFSNIGETPVQVVITAKMRLKNGATYSLGLIDPEKGEIGDSVVLTLPAARRRLDLIDLSNIVNVNLPNGQFTMAGQRARPKPPQESDSQVEQQLKDVSALRRHQFIPLAQNKALLGERRYSATIGYHIPKISYIPVLDSSVDLTADLTLGRAFELPEGTVEWQVRFLDAQTLKTWTENVHMFAINGGLEASAIQMKNQLVEQTKPIDAAMFGDSKTGYVFSGNMYAKVNPETGELISSWKKITEYFNGDSPLLAKKIKAAVRVAFYIYLFFEGTDEYIEYNLIYDKIEKTGKIEEMNPSLFGIPNPGSVGKCLKDHLDLSRLDAAFRDGWDVYFIAGDNYVKIEDIEGRLGHKCIFGKVSDKEEWNVAAGKKITAVLSDYDKDRGRLRFYLDGFESVVLLNKPDVFKDERNTFVQEVGDSDIASLKLDSGYGVQARWVVPGVHGYAYADLDLYLFGHPLSLFSARGEGYGNVGRLHPYLEAGSVTAKAKSGIDLKLKMMGYTFASQDSIKEVDVTTGLDPQSLAPARAYERGLIPKPKFDGTLMSWKETYEVFKVRVPAGPIMLTMAGGIEGELKVATPVALDDRPEQLHESVSVRPAVNTKLKAYTTGGVDYEFAKAGVEGDINIVETGVDGELRASLCYDAPKTAIDFNVTAKIAGHIRLINAALLLYAGTKTHIDWCSSWGVPYPCGLGWDVWEIPLYETPWLYNYEPTLLESNLVGFEIPLK